MVAVDYYWTLTAAIDPRFSLLRGIADIGPLASLFHSASFLLELCLADDLSGTNMLATGGAAVTKIIGTATAPEAARDDLNLPADAFRTVVDVLKSALGEKSASSVLVTQIANKEDVLRSLSHEYRTNFDILVETHGLESDHCYFCQNPAGLSWLQVLPVNLLLPLEPSQCNKLRALKLPKSLLKDR